MTNIAVTFRKMLPDEDLLTYVREGCLRIGGEAWSVFVEAQPESTRVSLIRRLGNTDERVEATHEDRFEAARDALAQLS